MELNSLNGILKSKFFAEDGTTYIEEKRQSGGSNITTVFLSVNLCYGGGKKGHRKKYCSFEKKNEQHDLLQENVHKVIDDK